MKHKAILSLFAIILGVITALQKPLCAQSNTLLPIIIEGKWGIINPKGEVLIRPQYDFMPKFDLNGLATIIENGKLGIIDSLGTKVITSKYDDLRIINRQLYLASLNGLWGVIQKNEEALLPIQYDQIIVLSEDYFQVKKGDKVGLTSCEGNMIVPIEYEQIKLAQEDYYLVSQDEKWGIFEKGKGLIQSCEFNEIEAAEGDIFFVKKEGVWGTFLADTKKLTIDTQFDSETVLQKGLPYIMVNKNKMSGLYHKNGEVILSPSAIDIQFYSEDKFMVRYENNRWGILNAKGEWLVSPKWQDCEKMNDNFAILYNAYGKKALFSSVADSVVTPAKFDWFERFSDELMIAKGGGGNALVTQRGQLIAMGEYKTFKSLNEGIYAAYDGVNWFLFNSTGKKIGKSGFKSVSTFLPQLKVAKVAFATKKGLLKPNGEWFIKPEYNDIRVFDDVIKAYQAGKVTLFYLDETGRISDSMLFNDVSVIKVNSLEIGEKNFSDGISSDSTLTRFRTGGNDGSEYREIQFGTFNNRWAIWNARKQTFKSLEAHKIVRFLYTFGKYEIRFGWMYPNKVVYNSRSARGNRLNISNKKETLDYSKQVFNKPKKLPIGYVGEFHEGRARINIGGTFKSVGVNAKTKQYDLGEEVKGLITVFHRKRLAKMVGRTTTTNNTDYTYICAGGFWSFIDEEGELIGEFDYSYVSNYYKGFAIAERKGKWGIIDQNNNEVVPFNYNYIDYLPNSDSTLLRLHANEKLMGYVDSLGNQIVPTQFEDIKEYTEGLAQAQQNGLWGFIDKKGEWIIEKQFEEVKAFNEGVAPAKQNRQWGFIDKTGNWVIEPQFRDVGVFKEGMAAAKQSVLFGYINRSGTWVIAPKFQRAEAFEGELAIAKVKGKFGLIDKQGNWKVSPKFKSLRQHNNNYFIASKNAWGLIDSEGKELTHFKYSSIDDFSEGYALVRKKAGNYYKSTYGFIDSLGNEVISPQFNIAGSVQNGLIRVKNLKENWKYINLKGEEIISGDYISCADFSEGKATVFTKKGYLQGGKFIDTKGNILFEEADFEAVSGFQQGRAVVRNPAGEYALIDSLGQVVNNAYYQKATPFQHKVNFVQKEGKWAISSITSMPLSSFKFDEVTPFKNGLAKVAINIHYGIVTLDGKAVAPPHFETVQSINKEILMVASANRIGYINIQTRDWLWPLQN